MRFLKNKILRAQGTHKNTSESLSPLHDLSIKSEAESTLLTSTQTTEGLDSCYTKNYPEDKTSQSKDTSRSENDSSLKNMTINYGRAIVKFIASPLAVPYLQIYLEKENINMKEFLNFVKNKKNTIAGICSFRALLLIEKSDTEKIRGYKKTLQFISEVFIKYFSVNWIMTGRLTHKIIYLKFRFKMLRRIQNPHLFTYIKERKTTKKACQV